ncbi:MAG: TonB-dependent receptor, partial [Verrucomicrobiota bacterium]
PPGFGGPTGSLFRNQVATIIGPAPYFVDFTGTADRNFRNYAFFGEVEYDITDNLVGRAGLRYDNVQNSQMSELQYSVQNTTLSITDSGEEQTDLSALLPSASLTYEFDEDTTLSFLYKKSYRTGGVAISPDPILGQAVESFDPEFTDTVELAYRAVNIGDFDISANVYFTSWEDQQISIQNPQIPAFNETSNAGASEQYGFEGQVSYTPTERLNFYTSVAFARTEFTDYVDPNTGEVFTGNQFPYAPETMVNGGVTAEICTDLFFNVNFNYQDEAFVNPENTHFVDSRFVVNASLTYDKELWYVSLFSYNIFDELYVTQDARNAAGFSPTLVVGDPTVIGIKGGIRF